MIRRVTALLGLGLLVSCASTQEGGDDSDTGASPAEDNAQDLIDQNSAMAPGRGEAVPTVRYERTAEANWIKGEEAFAAEEYLAAQRYFGYIRTKFPYSRYAVRSELRVADCQFGRGRFIEAIDSFQNFVRLHPTHEKVPYALYKVGLGYFEQIPSDWFMLPPSEEKDQAAVRDAARALGDYVSRFPDDENIPHAKEVLSEVRGRLMAHERYVADFYKNLEKDRAYVGRLEVIRTRFADVGLDDELLVEIIEVYARLGERAKANDALSELEKKFPSSDELGYAKSLVSGIATTTSTAAEAG